MARLTVAQERRVVAQQAAARKIALTIHRNAPPNTTDASELVSIAYLGLVESSIRYDKYCEVNGYDPNADYFGAFAARRVRGAVLDHLRASDYATRSERDTQKALRRAAESLNGTASPAEVANAAGVTLEVLYSNAASLAKRPEYLEDDTEIDISDVTELSSTDRLIGYTLATTVASLPKPQQVILALHYFEEMDLQDIALEMGIAESRASKLHIEAVMAVYEAISSLLV